MVYAKKKHFSYHWVGGTYIGEDACYWLVPPINNFITGKYSFNLLLACAPQLLDGQEGCHLVF
jgi:hypothetical protein